MKHNYIIWCRKGTGAKIAAMLGSSAVKRSSVGPHIDRHVDRTPRLSADRRQLTVRAPSEQDARGRPCTQCRKNRKGAILCMKKGHTTSAVATTAAPCVAVTTAAGASEGVGRTATRRTPTASGDMGTDDGDGDDDDVPITDDGDSDDDFVPSPRTGRKKLHEKKR